MLIRVVGNEYVHGVTTICRCKALISRVWGRPEREAASKCGCPKGKHLWSSIRTVAKLAGSANEVRLVILAFVSGFASLIILSDIACRTSGPRKLSPSVHCAIGVPDEARSIVRAGVHIGAEKIKQSSIHSRQLCKKKFTFVVWMKDQTCNYIVYSRTSCAHGWFVRRHPSSPSIRPRMVAKPSASSAPKRPFNTGLRTGADKPRRITHKGSRCLAYSAPVPLAR